MRTRRGWCGMGFWWRAGRMGVRCMFPRVPGMWSAVGRGAGFVGVGGRWVGMGLRREGCAGKGNDM